MTALKSHNNPTMRYIYQYRNKDGGQFEWPFSHVWCEEDAKYIIEISGKEKVTPLAFWRIKPQTTTLEQRLKERGIIIKPNNHDTGK
jgi:hypothetical protein